MESFQNKENTDEFEGIKFSLCKGKCDNCKSDALNIGYRSGFIYKFNFCTSNGNYSNLLHSYFENYFCSNFN